MAIAPLIAVNDSKFTYKIHKWVMDAPAETEGEPLSLPDLNDKTVTVSGTFASDTVTIKGSNDGVVYFTLSDAVSGNPLTFAEGGIAVIKESPAYIKPTRSDDAASVNLVTTITSSGLGR